MSRANQILTLEALEKMKPGTIFAEGYLTDTHEGDGINLARTGKRLYWLAERGQVHDWCIYHQPAYWDEKIDPNKWDLETILYKMSDTEQWKLFTKTKTQEEGDKLTVKAGIRQLVPCTDEAFKAYRY